MFGSIGMTELLTILVLVLVLFGPKRIPELARGFGKALNELKRAAEDVKSELDLNDLDKPMQFKKPHSGTENTGSTETSSSVSDEDEKNRDS